MFVVFDRHQVCRMGGAFFVRYWQDILSPSRDDAVILPEDRERRSVLLPRGRVRVRAAAECLIRTAARINQILEVQSGARSMISRGSCQPVCWLWMGILLMPAGPARGQVGRDLISEPRAGGRPEWTAPLGLGGGGAMFVPAISPADPRLMLLGCDMTGSYRSTDGGRNWEMIHYRELTDTTQVRPVWHPTDPAVAFAVNDRSGTLKVTRDSGKTWSVVPGVLAGVSAIAVDPGRPELMLVGGDGNLHRSTNGGRTWKKVGGYRGHLLGFHLDQTSPAEARTCLAATDRGLLRSDDAGASWNEVAGGLPAGKMVAFAGGSRREGNLCVLYGSVEAREANGRIEGGIFRSVRPRREPGPARWARASTSRLTTRRGDRASGPHTTSSS